jgi:hypothetical protein
MTQPKLPRKKGDTLEVDPTQLLAFAIQAEEVCAEKGWAYGDLAFIAGLHYDWLAALFAKHRAPKDALETLKTAYGEGLEFAKKAYRHTEKLKNLKHGRYVFAAGLLVPLGQPLMAALYKRTGDQPTWLDFLKECEEYGDRKGLAVRRLESMTFDLTSQELGSLYLNAFGLFQEVEPAIRFAYEPYMLTGQNPDLKALAEVLKLATKPTPQPGAKAGR